MLPVFVPSRLTLGTVQLGLPYGLANSVGQPSEAEAFAILDAAVAGGIKTLDTARAYGTSEDVIGRWRRQRSVACHVVTKLTPLTMVASEEMPSVARNSLREFALAIGGEPIDLVLAHRETDLLVPAVRAVLEGAIQEGLIAAYGASVSTIDGALRLMDAVPIAAIQLPASLADRRFEPVVDRANRLGTRVFARSIFLQGALLMKAAALPAHLALLKPALKVLLDVSMVTGISATELCLLAVRDRKGIDSLVVGVDSAHQLTAHIAAIDAAPLAREVTDQLDEAFGGLPDKVLDPGCWPK